MKSHSRAFSLVEILLMLSVVAILATLSVISVNRVCGNASGQKLTSDSETLNRAVMAYVASGGEVSSFSGPDEVLTALKKTAASGSRTAGLSGAVIDPRIRFVPQSPEEAASPRARILWNAVKGRFEVVQGGGATGIASVELSEEAPPQLDEESDRTNPVLYAKESTWIWDYQEKQVTTPAGPSSIPLADTPDSTTPPGPPPVPPGPVATTSLDPPLYSIPSGSYPASDFNLSLTLTDPNPSGTGLVYYSIDYGNWVKFTGTISVPAGAVVAAQTLPAQEGYSSSSRVEQRYRIQRSPLSVPSIQLSAAEFTDTLDTIGVRITNPNDSGVSTLHYALSEPGEAPPSRSLWASYAGDFAVTATEFPAGFTVHAYARAVQAETHVDSASTQGSAGANFTFSDAGSGAILYVIDASGSMNTVVGGSTRFQLVKEALTGAISRLRPSSRFGVVTFAGDVLWTSGFGDLLPAHAANKQSLINEIAGFSTDHNTNYEAALRTPLLFSSKPSRVYFLTDGEPTGGGGYSDEVDALVAAGIKVDTIGVDLTDAGQDRLNEIANQTGGSFIKVSTN